MSILSRILLISSLFFAPVVAQADTAKPPLLPGCAGKDLIAALPEASYAALREKTLSAPYAEGLFFKAERDGKVIHLFGTYHLPDPRHDASLALVRPALQGATRLLVEAGPEEEAALKKKLVSDPQLIALPTGKSLPELLAPMDWKQLSDQMKERGIPPQISARLRPWYLSIMLGTPQCALAQLQAGGEGIDHQLMADAKAQGIPLQALEPSDTLFAIFKDLTLEDEIALLRTSLEMSAKPEDMAVTLANSYFAGQPRLIWEFSVRDSETRGADPAEARKQFALMEEVLMAKRNRAWMPVILTALDEGPVFVASGALHLSGDEGLLALLEAQGFEITRLDG